MLIWIGLSDLATENTFVWEENGQPMAYDNFIPGNPDNADNNEHCVQIVYINNGAYLWEHHWNDGICSFTKPFVCEKSKYE